MTKETGKVGEPGSSWRYLTAMGPIPEIGLTRQGSVGRGRSSAALQPGPASRRPS